MAKSTKSMPAAKPSRKSSKKKPKAAAADVAPSPPAAAAPIAAPSVAVPTPATPAAPAQLPIQAPVAVAPTPAAPAIALAPISISTAIDYRGRRKLLKQLESARKSKVLLYVTGDRPGWQTQISTDVLDIFIDHLDAIGVTKKISLLLYTTGGDTLAAWNIINLVRAFCDELEVILPSKGLSAGTLMCLSANTIVMTKQATLGPIDPSIMGPLNPMIPGAPPGARAPVSVEAIRGYIDLARKELGIKGGNNLAQIFTFLSQQIHPLVLGQIFRSRTQIQFLARRLLANHMTDAKKTDRIVAFLCSETGSHDYTINRREARDHLGLNVETPSEVLYRLIRSIHLSFRAELLLNQPYDPNSLLGKHPQALYSFKRCFIESVRTGCHSFVSEGVLTRVSVVGPGGTAQQQHSDTRTFEGWKKIA